MNNPHRFSDVSKNYLCTFYGILDNMIRGMTEAELTDSIPHNFIVQMIPHHQAAIDMGNNILRYTTCVDLQDIASRIVAEQTRSIENMRKIEPCCDEFRNSRQDLCVYQHRVNQILQTMFADMRNALATNRIDCDFMREMLPHHRGAVELSTNALGYPLFPSLKPILEAIITSQRRGIVQMQNLMHRIGCPGPF